MSDATLSALDQCSDEILSETDFATVREIALKEAGLVLPDSKRLMVQSRLARRVRSTGAASVKEYVTQLRKPDAQSERVALISALTTNVTSFFREAHHFETLREDVLPRLIDNLRKGGRTRIWSAGCSSGEEAYSLALLITHLCPEAPDLDVKILATDIDHTILAKAKRGVYQNKALTSIPEEFRKTWRLETLGSDETAMPSNLRSMISFRHLNLHDAWPMKGSFDVIMCRNVVIYFDASHQAALWPRFSAKLNDDGWLFLGHSERIHPIEGSGFVGKGLTTYRKSVGHPTQNIKKGA